MCETNASVSGRSLNYSASRQDALESISMPEVALTIFEHVPTLLLSIPDNPKSSSILYATAWILEFSLSKDSTSRLFRKLLKINLDTAESEN